MIIVVGDIKGRPTKKAYFGKRRDVPMRNEKPQQAEKSPFTLDIREGSFELFSFWSSDLTCRL